MREACPWGRVHPPDIDGTVEAAGTLRRIANQMSSIAIARALLKCRNYTPSRILRASGSYRRFVAISSRGWIFFSGAECFSAPAARAIAQKHSAGELAEPLNEFRSHLKEGGFARIGIVAARTPHGDRGTPVDATT
jgi:hypothetical protein